MRDAIEAIRAALRSDHAARARAILGRHPELRARVNEAAEGGGPVITCARSREVTALLQAGARPPDRTAGTDAVKEALRRHSVED